MSNSATQVRTAQIGGGRISDGPANLRASFSASKVSAGHRTTSPKILSVLYTARVIGLALPYVFTFAAVLGGDLYSQWAHVMFHPIGQFMLAYALAHVTANICFNFRRGGALVRTVNGVGAVLCVAVSPLWVNLIMDTFGAMALASLPPSQSVMKDKPRDRKAFILTKPMMKDILGVGGFFFLLLVVFLYIFQHTEITQMTDLLHCKLGEANGLSPYEQTLLFSIFVWTHLWYMFNTRSFETGKSFFQLKMSKEFFTIVAIIFIGQIVIVEVLYDFFNCTPMKLIDWVIIVVLSSLVLWARELWHLLTKRG